MDGTLGESRKVVTFALPPCFGTLRSDLANAENHMSRVISRCLSCCKNTDATLIFPGMVMCSIPRSADNTCMISARANP